MPFWQTTELKDMSKDQWESLCDGCGKCCLHKLECIDTGDIVYTDVACRMLDCESATCTRYETRKRWVSNCVILTPSGLADKYRWMPSTCAYRRLAEGKSLPAWHPLISGDPESVKHAGMSVAGRVTDEREASDLEDHVVDWPR